MSEEGATASEDPSTAAAATTTVAVVNRQTGSLRRIWIVAVVAGGLVLGACGDDSEPDESGSAGDDISSDDAGGDAGDIAGSVDDSDLIVPRDYLQGVWCDSDGEMWTIEGDIAELDDGAGGTGSFPLDVLFLDGPEEVLVSQSDDEFTIDFGDQQITFTRGSC